MPMPLPAVTTSAMRQHRSSMYQQHTFLDRQRGAVTDVIFQEHVSQSSWAMTTPQQPIFMHIPAACPAPPPPPPAPPGYSFMPTGYMASGGQYFGAVPGSMNGGYSQMYASSRSSTTTSCNMPGGGGVYMPAAYVPPPAQYYANQPAFKQSCDASTQADLISGAPPLMKLNQTATTSSTASSYVLENAEESEYVSTSSQTNSSTGIENGGGDGLNALQSVRRNSEVTLPQQRLLDITRVSLYGSEIAEKLANTHRNRPCFKKIDTLCARLKQDLLRPDGVLPNINSQGIAWAVKDFIFVFTRIINAWVILRGYVYNTPEGLNKIKDELPRGFMTVFDGWQCGTLLLIEMIIKSFVNLDDLLQKQKNSFSKCDANNNNNNSSTFNSINNNKTNVSANSSDSSTLGNTLGAAVQPTSITSNAQSSPKEAATMELGTSSIPDGSSTTNLMQKSKSSQNLNYLYTMIENSEERQRSVDANGTYLKTGTYTPLKKESKLDKHDYGKHPELPTCMPVKQHETNITYENWQSLPPEPSKQEAYPMQEVHKQTPQRRHADVSTYINPFSIVGREITRSLLDFSERLLELQSTERFFEKQFTRNYYPDLFLRCHQEFIDLRSIIMRCENGVYHHVHEAIHDVRRISYVVRNYLKVFNNEDLRHYIDIYDQVVNEMLSQPPHLPYQYDHITGRPGEKLFNYEI
ncbi:protein mitoshell [Scaptodrosophila lebanonensis]|uniref:Protein mitoshell n=1 Tax=Drosophila lebanonensis TaxID=7225 RepID=A0A6J2U6L1_DROLE|nr:protein mitoshell [Scaptodrosophila lebanonensis]